MATEPSEDLIQDASQRPVWVAAFPLRVIIGPYQLLQLLGEGGMGQV